VPRVEYPYEFTILLRYDEMGAVIARYAVRLRVLGGVRRRWAVALQVYERAAASEMSHATTIGMTSCVGTSQAIHPGEWSWSSQSLASMP
jgi:hypothetical protein